MSLNLSENELGQAVLECLKEGNSEGMIEITRAYLEAVNTKCGWHKGLSRRGRANLPKAPSPLNLYAR